VAAKFSITTLAAGTTITVNMLEIKSTAKKLHKTAKVVGKTTKKIAKKAVGKS
jgi:hypothetical protein